MSTNSIFKTNLLVSDLDKINYSGDIKIDSLLDNNLNWNYLNPFKNVLNYTFDVKNFHNLPSITAFNSAQQTAVQTILNDITSITGIIFNPVTTNAEADIHFANTDLKNKLMAGLTNNSYSYEFIKGKNIVTKYSADSYVYLDNVEWNKSNATPSLGSFGYEALLHEIGHALGLKHPFEQPNKLPKAENNTNNTVMSYTHKGEYKSAFQSNDLAALKWIYGSDGVGGEGNSSIKIIPPLKATSGNDVLIGTSKSENINGLAGNDTLEGGKGNDQLTGGTGKDVFVFNIKDYDFVGDFAPRIQNLDRITDFEKGIDSIQLSAEFLSGKFTIVNKITNNKNDANLIYETGTGVLYFDADGSQNRYTATAFLKLTGKINLDENDFILLD